MVTPAGAPTQSWLEKWSEWEIQAVVAVSFGLQVILFFLAGIRRYSVSSVLKVFLWLVYLLADTAAIYALGHMSASLSRTSSDKHQLVAFWAPFLLLHLGGQDTITAYALEDNKLWLRHLLTMFVQVTGTGYVLYKYIIAERATIVAAAMYVSAAGVVKYGERILALKRASKGSNKPNRPVLKPKYEASDCFTRNEKFRTYAFIVMTAHKLQYAFVKPLIIDRNSLSVPWNDNKLFKPITHVDKYIGTEDKSAQKKKCMEVVYREIEVELALTYDMLYTKAEVIHKWYGYLIRGISSGFCFGALLAFTRSKRDRYSAPDIVITFVLLGGACALEVISAFKVIGSTWTYAILTAYGCKWLANAILFARYHFIVLKDGRWSNSVGQYDFISFCASDKTLKGRIAGWIGLEDWWNKAHYTKHAKLSPALKEFVWGLLRGEKNDMVQIEDLATRRGYWDRKFRGFNQSQKLDWSLRLEFHYCVYIWHISTNTFLSDPAVKSDLVDQGMAEAINTLSDYMMYLLVQHPDIVPMNVAARSLFKQAYRIFVREFSRKKHTMDKGALDAPQQVILGLMELYRDERNVTDPHHELKHLGDYEFYPAFPVMVKASILVHTLLDMELELTHKLAILGTVWKEMLCFTADNASGDFHARQLSNGGEFVTHMLLLSKYSFVMGDADYNPVEVAGHVELNVHNDHQGEIAEDP